MPYQPPSPPTPPPPLPRANHQRNRSRMPSFSNERGPGAFAPLSNLPRRSKMPDRERKPMFQLSDDIDDDNDGSDGSPPPSLALQLSTEPTRPPQPAPASAPVTGAGAGTVLPQLRIDPIEPIPFPSSEPRSPAAATPLPRTPSTPVLLSNGKPLKPSLKSSLSSPAIAPFRSLHSRAQSAPSTPSHKNVHFPEKDTGLESIVVFEKSQRPRAVSGNMGDETETETEGYDSSASNATTRAFPFPVLGDNPLEMDTALASPVPNPNPPRYANIHFETISFPSTRPPTLRGSVIVRNIAFEKIVAVRFTMDDWQTTSEVTCKHVCSLPSLPPPFPQEKLDPGVTPSSWDRFSFVVRLEDVERKLAERTIWMVARFTVPGDGEWWDNNSDQNYRVAFRRSTGPPNRTTSSPPKFASRVASFIPASFTPAADTYVPPASSYHIRAATSPAAVPARPTPPQRSPATSTASISPTIGTLKLSNYVSPATPPATPRSSSANLASVSPPKAPGAIIGGQPTSSPVGSYVPWPSSPQPPSKPETTMNGHGLHPFMANGVNGPLTNGTGGQIDTNDSSYAAFVKQWCFHQSPSTLSPAPTPPDQDGPTTPVGFVGSPHVHALTGADYRSPSPVTVAGLS